MTQEVTQDIIQADRSIFRRYKDLGDGTHAEVVFASNTTAQRELLVSRYTVKTAFTDAAVGNIIRRTDVIELGTVSTVVAVLWSNETTGLDISAPPSITGNLSDITMGSGLTQAQIMGAGLATSSNQLTALGYLADLADNPHDKFANYKLRNTEDLGAGQKSILKVSGLDWLLIKKAYSATGSFISYASKKNNPTVLTPVDAWNARNTAIYGEISEV